jgi:hypothetical protein
MDPIKLNTLRDFEVNYRFIEESNKIHGAAISPLKEEDTPQNPAQTREELLQREVDRLVKKSGKTAKKDTKLGVSLQSKPVGTYQTSIQLSGKKLITKDVFVPNSPLNGQKYIEWIKYSVKPAPNLCSRIANYFSQKFHTPSYSKIIEQESEDSEHTKIVKQEVEVHSAITSSFNRLADTITLLRKVEDEKGNSHCYAGRADTKGLTPIFKAEEMARTIFLGEFNGTEGKGIEKIGEDTYSLQFAVQSLLGSIPVHFLDKELSMLKDEIKAYRLLAKETEKKPIEIQFEGRTVYVKVLPPLISQTQFNWVNQYVTLGDSWMFGDLDAQEISKEGDRFLLEQAKRSTDPLVKDAANRLEKGGLKPWEEVFLRAYLCHSSNLPEVVHCKSSVDRTGIAVAIISAMRQWLDKNRQVSFGNKPILEIAEQDEFKELFACHLEKGLIMTKLSRGKQGYKFNFGCHQSLALQDLLPDRYLRKYTLKERCVAIFARFVALLVSWIPIVRTLGGITKAIRMKSLKGFDVWLTPFKAFRPNVFPEKVINEEAFPILLR